MSFFIRLFNRQPSITPQELGPVLTTLACKDAIQLQEALSRGDVPIREINLEQIEQEFAFVYVHIADRLLFQSYSQKIRDMYIDKLGMIVSMLPTSTKTDKSSQSSDLRPKEDTLVVFAKLNERSEYYGQFKAIMVKPDEPQKGSLLWEFGCLIAEIIGDGHGDINVIMSAYVIAANRMNAISEFIRR